MVQFESKREGQVTLPREIQLKVNTLMKKHVSDHYNGLFLPF